MNKSSQMAGVWCGVGFVLLFFFACWPMSHFLPPPSPLLTGEQLLAKYAGNMTMVLLSMPAGMIAGVLVIPFSAVLALQLARMEGRLPVWAITCVGAGAANAVAFYLPFFIFATAYFRTDRSPDLVLLLSDLGWIEFVTVYPPVALQMLCVAIVGLSYKGPLNIIPRWFAYLSLWMVVGILPAGFVILFKDGPFAWNGAIGFWLPAFCFGAYWLLLSWIMRRAVQNQAAEEQTASPTPV